MPLTISTIVDAQRAKGYEDSDLWPNRTLAAAFDEVLTRNPDKVLVVAAGGVRWTYREVAEKVDILAHHLMHMGIVHGDVISAQMPNWAEFMLIHLAATRLGAVTNPLLPIYRAKELSYILDFAKTKMVFIPSSFRNHDYVGLYRELRRGLPSLEHIVVVGPGCPTDMTSFDALTQRSGMPRTTPWPSFDGNEVTLLIFTSGTEASPKGVVHSHNTLMFGNLTVAKVLNLTSDEIIWAISPITHATGLEWSLRQAIVLGGTVVMQGIWDVEAALDLIEGERCTFTTAATPFATMLLDSPTLAKRNLSSFRTFLCGGAAIPEALGRAMFERMGCRLIPCWGMSECFVATVCAIDEPVAKQWSTDGRALPDTETEIFDESRTKQLEPGAVGEIATRGPHVCLGYFNDSERTAETFSSDGWLFSNDLGTKDADGYLRVVGRKKDIINRGGLKISAAEVEGMILRHPNVRAVAIVGVPDPQIGEKSCAFVVPAAPDGITLEDLTSLLKQSGMAAYKLPEYLVLLAELPMTPTGKVQKFRLRESWVSGMYTQGGQSQIG